MIVEEIMNTDVFTLEQGKHTIGDAVHLMREKNIRHIPIVNSTNKVVGIVTAHDIKNAMPSTIQEDDPTSHYDVPIETIMVENPIIGHPLDFVEEVALTFYDTKISCLPIVSGGELIGIVTTTDLLYTYIELTGTHKPGSKIDIRVTDKIGILHEITKVFSKYKANVLSILIYPDPTNDQNRILSIRLQVMNPLAIIKDLRNAGFDVLWPNVPGIRL